MQKFPGSSKIFPIFDSKMGNMDINLFERERQTNKQTNKPTNFSPRSHRGKGRDSPWKLGGGEQPRPQGFWGEDGGVINGPLIFNLSW